LLAWLHANPGIDYVLPEYEWRAPRARRRFSRWSRKDVSLRQVPALSPVRRRAGSRAAVVARRRFSRTTQARHRAVQGAEYSDHPCDDGHVRKSAAPVGHDRIRTPIPACARRSVSADVPVGKGLWLGESRTTRNQEPEPSGARQLRRHKGAANPETETLSSTPPTSSSPPSRKAAGGCASRISRPCPAAIQTARRLGIF
jgi:hypothetical protein